MPWWDENAARTTQYAIAMAANLAGFLMAFVAPNEHGEYWSPTRDVSLWLLLTNQMLARCRLAVGLEVIDSEANHRAIVLFPLFPTLRPSSSHFFPIK